MNPVMLTVAALGIALVIIGWRGSYNHVWYTLTGKTPNPATATQPDFSTNTSVDSAGVLRPGQPS